MKHYDSVGLFMAVMPMVRAQGVTCPAAPSQIDTSWYAPNATQINDLSTVINETGIYGFIFNGSADPVGTSYYTYNWCNMPHVRSQEYVVPSADFELTYLEIIHRHHKRTPYASNTFPIENYAWLCDDESLYYYGAPYPEDHAARIAWSIAQSPLNPFIPTGFPNSTCQFPQITGAGLYDSRQHGTDLFEVYHKLLGFLPSTYDPSKVVFRVTNNVITSQVASQVAIGMYGSLNGARLAVTVQPATVDSLEPTYSCSYATSSYSSYGVGSTSPAWQLHLNMSHSLFAHLDAVSGVNSTDSGWHNWFDHYFDNLSAKLCHQKPLPYNNGNHSLVISESDAEAVFRRGEYEYSFIYRDSNASLAASTASYGVWMGELANHLRAAMVGGNTAPIYRHNVAHDGSISRLLSILQIDQMVWPGMGSEVAFELWKKKTDQCFYLRVLWKGQVMHSSNPMLGAMDLIPISTFLAYVDALVGVNASRVPQLCAASLS